MAKTKDKTECIFNAQTFSMCKLPMLDPKKHRAKVKKYLKAFNKAIEKAIEDDELVLKISCEDNFNTGYRPNDFSCTHSIKFTDKKLLKL